MTTPEPHRSTVGTMEGEPWQWSAAAIATAVRTRAVTASDVAASVLDRIRATNPTLDALVDVDEEDVLAAAAAADRAVADGRALGPLHGVPTSIKINTDQRGLPTTNGVVAYTDDVAPDDSTVAAALRRAGAIFVGRSNAPAFSLRWFTDNALHGATSNPWSAERTPGGSSGGAASAVAAGMLPIAQGNDIGGSIRYPAYACGVAGLRPTIGVISSRSSRRRHPPTPSINRHLMSTHGPIAREVADLRSALRAMVSVDVREAASVPIAPLTSVPVETVGVVRGADSDTVVQTALDDATAMLRDAGIRVQEVELPELVEASRLWGLLNLADLRLVAKVMADLTDDATVTSMENVLAFIAEVWGDDPGLDDLAAGWTRRNALVAAVHDRFDEMPVMLTPPSSRPPFLLGADTAGGSTTRAMIDAQWPQTALPTLGLPGVSVPTGVADGLPTGVQVIGPRFSDETLLDVAQLIEDRAGTITPVTPWGQRARG